MLLLRPAAFASIVPKPWVPSVRVEHGYGRGCAAAFPDGDKSLLGVIGIA